MKLIQEKNIEKIVNNEELLLNQVWTNYREPGIFYDSRLIEEEIISKINEALEVVCLSTNALLTKNILISLSKVSEKGVRIYILTNSYEQEYNGFLINRAVIRVNEKVPGFLILIDPRNSMLNSTGFVASFNSFTGKQSTIPFFVYNLNGQQLKEAFHYFTKLFWDSIEEYRGQSKREDIVSASAPFDVVPLIDPENFHFNTRNKSYLDNKVKEVIKQAQSFIHIGIPLYEEENEILELLKMKAENNVKIFLYTGFQSSQTFIQSLSKLNNVFIYSIAILKSYFVICDMEKGLFLSGRVLDSDQVGVEVSKNEIQSFIEKLKKEQNSYWVYHDKVTLKELKASNIKYENFNMRENDIMKIDDMVEVVHEEIKVSDLKVFIEGNVSPDLKGKNFLAREIIHRWKLIPPYREKNYKKDSLYDQWEKEKTLSIKYTNDVLAYAKKVKEEKRNFMSSFFGRFLIQENFQVDKMLPKLESILKDLQEQPLNSEMLTNMETVKSIANQLVVEHLEINDKKEYHTEKTKWEEKEKKIKIGIEGIKHALRQLQEEKVEVIKQMNNSNPELDDQQKKIDEEIKKINIIINEIKNDNAELIEKLNANKQVRKLLVGLDEKIKKYGRLKNKQKKNYFEKNVKNEIVDILEILGKPTLYEEIMGKSNIKDSKEIMVYLKKELAVNPELRVDVQDTKEIEKQLEEHKASINKLNEEKEKIISQRDKENGEFTNKIKNYDQQITDSEKTLKEALDLQEQHGFEFSYTPFKSNSTSKLNLDFQMRIPKEDLPKVGTLYTKGNKRQLAIVYENEIALAENEAKRLSAELVVEI